MGVLVDNQHSTDSTNYTAPLPSPQQDAQGILTSCRVRKPVQCLAIREIKISMYKLKFRGREKAPLVKKKKKACLMYICNW